MAMTLYSDFVTDNPDPVLAQSDETVQAAIYDWFRYRYIGFDDTEKFKSILQRNVSVNYPIYQQKLRIQPGVSQYDWLVSMYRERQLKHTGTGSASTSQSTDGTTTSNGTNTHNVTLDQTTYDLTNKDAAATDSTTHSGTETQAAATDTTTHSTSETQAAAQDKHTYDVTDADAAATDVDTKTGGHSSTHTDGTKTTEVSPHVEKVTTNGGHVSNWAGHEEISAALPMSESFSSFVSEETGSIEDAGVAYSKAYKNMPSDLNWSTATAKGQSANQDYHVDKSTVTESYNYNSDGDGDITKTSQSTADKDTFTYSDGGEVDTRDIGARQHTKTGTDTADIGERSKTGESTDTANIGARSRDTSGTDTSNIGERTHTQTGTTSHLQTVSDGSTATGTTTQTVTGTQTSEAAATDREQVTGRNEDPATLLARATAFIEQSSAWLWLKEQLEPCFYPGYYTETGCDDEDYGSALI